MLMTANNKIVVIGSHIGSQRRAAMLDTGVQGGVIMH